VPQRSASGFSPICSLRPTSQTEVQRYRLRSFSAVILLLIALGATLQADSGGEPIRHFQPPRETRLEQLVASDGEPLLVRAWGATDSPQLILLGIHGFTDYGRGFAHLSTQLTGVAKHPMLVLAFDQRGFGESASRGRWAGLPLMLSDLDSVLAWIDRQHPGTPVILVGESMGAALVLAAFNREGWSGPASLRGVVLLAPAIWGWSSMPWYQRLSLEIGSALWPSLQVSGRGARQLGIRPTDDPSVAEYLGRDPNMLRNVSLGMLAGLTDLMEQAGSSRIPQQPPTLVAVGGRDRVIPLPAVCRWARQQAAEGAREQWLFQEEGYHMLTRQKAAGEVLDVVGHWIGQLLEGPTAALHASGNGLLQREAALAKLCS